MSLIHSAELCGPIPCDYLTELQHHASELAAGSSEWMPWNYGETNGRCRAVAGTRNMTCVSAASGFIANVRRRHDWEQKKLSWPVTY